MMPVVPSPGSDTLAWLYLRIVLGGMCFLLRDGYFRHHSYFL